MANELLDAKTQWVDGIANDAAHTVVNISPEMFDTVLRILPVCKILHAANSKNSPAASFSFTMFGTTKRSP